MSDEELFDRTLREALHRQPVIELPEHFSDDVLRKIERRELIAGKVSSWLYISLLGGFLLSALVCLLAFTDSSAYSDWLNKGAYIALVAVLLVVFQVIDRKLVRKRLQPF